MSRLAVAPRSIAARSTNCWGPRYHDGQVDGERLLEFLEQDLGLLAAYNYDKGTKLAFRHLTFQEVSVGRRLAQRWAVLHPQ